MQSCFAYRSDEQLVSRHMVYRLPEVHKDNSVGPTYCYTVSQFQGLAGFLYETIIPLVRGNTA